MKVEVFNKLENKISSVSLLANTGIQNTGQKAQHVLAGESAVNLGAE